MMFNKASVHTKLVQILLISLIVAGCSVEKATVGNEPPVVKKDLVKFDAEFGVLKLAAATVFFWPEGLSEPELTEVVQRVKKASLDLDRLMIELRELGLDKARLEGDFQSKKCQQHWAERVSTADASGVSWVEQWRELPEAASAEIKAERQACLKNQERRQQIALEMQSNKAKKQAAAIGTILKTLDPEYPSKQKNFKPVTAQGSTIEIKPGAKGVGVVDITLRDFFRKGITLTTQALNQGESIELDRGVAVEKQVDRSRMVSNASYDVARKLLRFTVPDLDEKGQPTGAVLVFVLERNPNFMGLARFAGDIALVKDGVVQRYGSAKLEGMF